MILPRWLPICALVLAPLCVGAAEITVDLRSRVEAFKGTAEWREVHLQQTLPVEKTAVIICDMWDKHWCRGATGRVNGLVVKMEPFLEAARKRAIQIIHAPSETMAFYQDAPQRKRMLALPKIELPVPLALADPPLPIDDKGGGCDTPDQFYTAWTREHPGLHIDASDVVSDSGAEIYSFLRQRGIRNLLVMGVHTNMCVLNRTFAIKKMTALGIRCILVRDLTDAMYNPEDAPHVSHDAGTQLVIEYIEKFWCPTTTSTDLLRAFSHQGVRQLRRGGCATGMLVKNYRGKNAEQEIWEFDAALVAQICHVLKQAANEEGQWTEKRGANGGVAVTPAGGQVA